jgi:small subunit ribosomal protein S20
MANIKTQKKRIKQDAKRRLRNMATKTRVKNTTKKVLTAIDAKDEAAVKEALPTAISAIDKAAAKGVIHRNAAARKKSMLAHRSAAK